MRLVFAAIQHTGPHESSREFCEAHPELPTKSLLREYYSRERIMTWKAKREFVEPDLRPLPKLAWRKRQMEMRLYSGECNGKLD